MKLLRPARPILFSLPFRSWNSLHTHDTMYQKAKNKPRGDFRNHARKEKKPQLTHFLCLPLVNSVSLPQLESSLATFKAAIPVSPSAGAATQRGEQNGPQEASIEQEPLIPDGALRPIGTLHLTLGVMSLPTKERLDEALRFFRSLDLGAMMHEAEDRARSKSRKGETDHTPQEQLGDEIDPAPQASIPRAPPRPFNVSLESLHALPRARSATVLHAAPVDHTSRLYPFCEMLRDRFLEAGFLLGENKGSQRQTQGQGNEKGEATQSQNQENKQLAADENKASSINDVLTNNEPSSSSSSLLEELPVNLAEEQRTQQRPPRPTTKPVHIPKSKPRPLLLHATVVNTIYVKVRPRRGGGGGKNNSKNNSRLTFDARDILDHYRDYYLDSLRTTPRSAAIATSGTKSSLHSERETPLPPNDANSALLHNSNASDDDPELKKRKRSPGSTDQESISAIKNPFVWAKDFPLESVCICEMGAKKLDPSEDGLNARLGEKYKVVEERSLNWDGPSSDQPVTQTEPGPVPDDRVLRDASSDGSQEGGVRVSSS